MIEVDRFCKERGLLDSFELLHFHLGSQISNIRNVKNALREAGRFYVEVLQAWRAAQVPRRRRRPRRRLRRLADQLRLVDELHDCRSTPTTSSSRSWRSATRPSVPHPNIVSESGRAVVAHHAVLVIDVLGVQRVRRASVPEQLPDDGAAGGARTCWRPTRT